MTDLFRQTQEQDFPWVYARKKRQRVELQERYCSYCDSGIPPDQQRGGTHDEAKGGCGHRLAPHYP